MNAESTKIQRNHGISASLFLKRKVSSRNVSTIIDDQTVKVEMKNPGKKRVDRGKDGSMQVFLQDDRGYLNQGYNYVYGNQPGYNQSYGNQGYNQGYLN